MSFIKPFAVFDLFSTVFGVCRPRSVLFGLFWMAEFDVAKPSLRVHHIRANRTLHLGDLGWCRSLASGEVECLVRYVLRTSGAFRTFVQVVVFGNILQPTFASWAFLFAFSASSNDLRVILVNCFLLFSFLVSPSNFLFLFHVVVILKKL